MFGVANRTQYPRFFINEICCCMKKPDCGQNQYQQKNIFPANHNCMNGSQPKENKQRYQRRAKSCRNVKIQDEYQLEEKRGVKQQPLSPELYAQQKPNNSKSGKDTKWSRWYSRFTKLRFIRKNRR